MRRPRRTLADVVEGVDDHGNSTPSSPSSSSSLFCYEYHQPQSSSNQVATSSTGTEFGFSVSADCSGDHVVIGTAGDPSAVYLFYKQQYHGGGAGAGGSDGRQQQQHRQRQYDVKTFHNPSWSWSVGTSNFGCTVKLTPNGERLLVGDSMAGRVYLYDRQGHLIHTFIDPALTRGEATGDDFFTNFGGAIDVSDDGSVVVIGASSSNMPSRPSMRAAGAVYVYRLQHGQHQPEVADSSTHGSFKSWNVWSEPIVIEEMHAQKNDNFGISVAVLQTSSSKSEDSSSSSSSSTAAKTSSTIRVLVGGYNANQGRGAALLYVLTDGDDSNKDDQPRSVPTTTTESDDRGSSDDTKGVDSPDYDDYENEQHSISSRPYRLLRSYISPDLQHSLGFGFAVDMTEEFVVIGARGTGVDKYPEAGAVYVYQTAPVPSSWSFDTMQGTDDDNYNKGEHGTNRQHHNSTNMHTEPLEGQLLSVLTTIHQPNRILTQNQFGGALAIVGRRLLIASLGDGTAYSYDLIDGDRTKGSSALTAQLIGTHAVAANPFSAGASVALSGDGRFGILGAPHALGKRGRIQGGAYGLCLPRVTHAHRSKDGADNYGDLFNTAEYSCPAIHLPTVPWYSTSYWSSWDSWSGKALSLTITILISLCLLFYRNDWRLHRDDGQQRGTRRRSRRSRRNRRQQQQVDEDEVQTLMQHQRSEIEMVEEMFRDPVESRNNNSGDGPERENDVFEDE